MPSTRRLRALLPAAGLGLALVAGVLGAAPVWADETSSPAPAASTPPTVPAAPEVEAAEALTRAEAYAAGELTSTPAALAALPGTGRLLSAGLPARLRAGVDGSQVQRELFRLADDLAPADRRRARALLARPTDGRRDPLGNGYRAPSRRTCGPHVCVHWVTRTADAPPGRAWVARTLRVLERVWRTEVDRLGYRAPLADGGRGGDDRFDVYLSDLGSLGAYGYCTPERAGGGAPVRSGVSAGFCVLDDDFAAAQFAGAEPVRSLKVTAAHEFFHAVQLAYTVSADPWFAESTAVWMEGRVFPRIDDSRQYLPYGQLEGPGRPLDRFQPTGFAQYGNWVFWQRLSDRFGDTVVRRVWRQAGRGAFSSQALRQVLSTRRGGLPAVLAEYGSALTDAPAAYGVGDRWPAGRAPDELVLGATTPRAVVRTRLDHLSTRSLLLRPDPAAAGTTPGTTLQVTVHGPRNPATAPGAHLRVVRTDGRVVSRALRLDRRGRGRTEVPFGTGAVASVTVTLANASTRFRCRQGTLLSCRGVARDDDRRFRVVARLLP